MKTGFQTNGVKTRGHKKQFRIPTDILCNDTDALTWHKSHRKAIEIQPVVNGNNVVFVWKTTFKQA